MDKSKAETYGFYSGIVLTILLFMWLPAYPESQFDFFLNNLIDHSIFADGYYKSSDYPFAARVVNAFSITYAVVTGIFMGIWRRKDIIKIIDKAWLWIAIFVVIAGYMFWISITHQEFSPPRWRSFGTTEAFHNNPIKFLFLLISKAEAVYAVLRIVVTYTLYYLSNSRNE